MPRLSGLSRPRLALLVAGTALTTVAAAAVVTAPEARTAAGTTVGGLPAGGVTRAALTALLNDALVAQPSAIDLTLGSRSATLARTDLGVRVDVDATVDLALDKAGSSRFDRVTGRAAAAMITPVLEEDEQALTSASEEVAEQASFPESHGTLRWADGAFTSTPPADGQLVAADEVRTALRAAVTDLGEQTAVVPVEVLPAHLTAAAVERVRAAAQALAAAPVRLSAGARTVEVEGTDLAPYLSLDAVGAGPGHAVALGAQLRGTESVVVNAAAALTRSAVQPVIGTPALTKVLEEKGSTSFRPQPATTRLVRSGTDGQTVTPAAVRAALVSAVRRTDRVVRVTAVPERAVTDAQVAQVDALLGTFTTKHACCQPRVKNIQRMAKTIDGTVIAPGETFSLNGIIGRRTTAKGYVSAPFILDGELSEDIGGGVSQFATTAFNAAFFAGVRLDSHQAHSFYISRYPPGREATVNFPTIDLRWTNDTTTPIVVRTLTDSGSVTVALFGRGDGRSVTGTTGNRTPVKGKDFRIKVSRTVTIPGQATRSQTFTTTYNEAPEH